MKKAIHISGIRSIYNIVKVCTTKNTASPRLPICQYLIYRVNREFVNDLESKSRHDGHKISYILKSGLSRDADNWILFTFAILSATLFLIHIAFLTLFKHNFTIFSRHSETYINGLQKYMLSFFIAF